VVSALNGGGESTNSNEASATTLSAFQSWRMAYFGCLACPQADATADPDGDGFSNLQEFQVGTDPTNSKSVFHITAVTAQGNDVQVTWTTVGGMSYVVQDASGYATNSFEDLSPLIFVPGNGESTTNYLDAGANTNDLSLFYRVRIAPGQ
jgi:hypothetical protein